MLFFQSYKDYLISEISEKRAYGIAKKEIIWWKAQVPTLPVKHWRELWAAEVSSSLPAQIKAFPKLPYQINSLKKQMQPLSLQLLLVFTSYISVGFCIAAESQDD